MNWLEKLNGVIDTIVHIMAYAPDFPYEDFLPPDKQDNLESVFAELRDRLREFRKEHGETREIANCERGIEDAYQSYRDGHANSGFLSIQAVLHILMRLGSFGV